jgi:hypothetical protein
METKGTVLLSFDVEEFDMPLEYGQQIPMQQQFEAGYEGFNIVMDIIETANIPTTLFTTANIALEYSSTFQSLDVKHEVASHTFRHSTFKTEDLINSRICLQDICSRPVTGLRMPRMRPVEMKEVKAAGYTYDSSINPTWIPGRYNNLKLPRTVYVDEGIVRLPASVTPRLRIPLFWLSFKNFPYVLFLSWVKQAIAKDGYVCLYFHPWEFIELSEYKIPGYAKKLAGTPLQQRFIKLIYDLKKHYRFSTINNFLKETHPLLIA